MLHPSPQTGRADFPHGLLFFELTYCFKTPFRCNLWIHENLFFIVSFFFAAIGYAQEKKAKVDLDSAGGISERSPNVVFFLVDDLGWSDVGCFGSEFYEKPNIDQLAQDGVKFTNAYAACHVCSPTRTSILTGKYPARLNLIKTSEFSRHGVLPRGTVKIRQKQDNIEFAAMVESVDQSLGLTVTKLEELGIEDDTVVIFFSDNGGMSAINVGNPKRVAADKDVDKAYATSCLPLRGAKGWLYEGGVHVPMIVKWLGKRDC